MKSKKRNIIICVFLIVIIIGSAVLGIKIYKDKEEKYIQSCVNEINNTYLNFEAEKSRNKKLEILEAQINEFDDYSELDKTYEAVTEAYETKIKQMKAYFIDYYDGILSKNTIEDITEVNDKEKLTHPVANLEELRDLIGKEKNITLTNKKANAYSNTIDDLVDLYNSRVKEIEEAEKKAKEEAEKKAAEEAKKKAAEEAARREQAEQEKNNSSNGSGSNETAGTSSSSSKVNTDGLIRRKWYDENGNLVSDFYIDEYGGVYDLDGNLVDHW